MCDFFADESVTSPILGAFSRFLRHLFSYWLSSLSFACLLTQLSCVFSRLWRPCVLLCVFLLRHGNISRRANHPSSLSPFHPTVQNLTTHLAPRLTQPHLSQKVQTSCTKQKRIQTNPPHTHTGFDQTEHQQKQKQQENFFFFFFSFSHRLRRKQPTQRRQTNIPTPTSLNNFVVVAPRNTLSARVEKHQTDTKTQTPTATKKQQQDGFRFDEAPPGLWRKGQGTKNRHARSRQRRKDHHPLQDEDG